MRLTLLEVREAMNGVKMVSLRATPFSYDRRDSWLVYPSAEGMQLLTGGLPVVLSDAQMKRLDEIYYCAVAYVELTGSIEGFPAQQLD